MLVCAPQIFSPPPSRVPQQSRAGARDDFLMKMFLEQGCAGALKPEFRALAGLAARPAGCPGTQDCRGFELFLVRLPSSELNNERTKYQTAAAIKLLSLSLYLFIILTPPLGGPKRSVRPGLAPGRPSRPASVSRLTHPPVGKLRKPEGDYGGSTAERSLLLDPVLAAAFCKHTKNCRRAQFDSTKSNFSPRSPASNRIAAANSVAQKVTHLLCWCELLRSFFLSFSSIKSNPLAANNINSAKYSSTTTPLCKPQKLRDK